MGAVDDRELEVEPVGQDSGDRRDLSREFVVVDRAHYASIDRAVSAIRRGVTR